jgi:hypothetical protein
VTLPTRSRPTFDRVPVEKATLSLPVCGWCGAVVLKGQQAHHAAWHESLNKTVEQARNADMLNRPLG